MKTDALGLEKYKIEPLPARDWKFTHLFDDIVMVRYVDTDHEGNIKRGSLFVPADVSRNIWRVGEVVMMGDAVKSPITVGCHVMFAADKGIPCVQYDGTQVVFLNVDRLFGVVERAE